jgi:NTE family protein
VEDHRAGGESPEGGGGSGRATGPRIALVLGGGGLKGFAHVGVLRALAERGIRPAVYAGTSIGSLIAAATVGGLQHEELAERAMALKRKHLFRINHMGMLMGRMRSPSIYLEDPLRELIAESVPSVKFSQLSHPLLVNTVDVEHGVRVVWGSPGLEDAWVRDAVYASCALPGYFPPGRVGGRTCVDGGVIDNLPVGIASLHTDLVIAVDVGNTDMSPMNNALNLGFASVYMRAATIMMHSLQQFPLARWEGPPMILIRPRVAREAWMDFGHTEANIAEGYRAGMKALENHEQYLGAPGGIFPKRRFELGVIPEKCTGCGLCVALAPELMGLDSSGKAFARTRVVEWSPADGEFVHHCPFGAIVATKLERTSMDYAATECPAPAPELTVTPPRPPSDEEPETPEPPAKASSA